MKKILPIFTVLILVLSGLGAVAITNVSTFEDTMTTLQKTEFISSTFPPYGIERYDNEYINVKMEGISTYYSVPGNPVVPKVVKTFELPFGVKNIQVEVNVNNVQEFEIEKEIRPGPPHLPLIASEQEVPLTYEKNTQVYSSEQLYPVKLHNVDISVGLNDDDKIVTNVAVSIYPIRYSPKLNTISFAEGADIKITYDLSDEDPFPAGEHYDMAIIAPRTFSLALNRLVRHKNNMEIKTKLTTTEWIYRNFDGVDKPEQIKRFILSEMENHTIKYVLLVGGLKNHIWANPRDNKNYGVKSWYVPVRYHNFYDDPEHPLSFDKKIYDPGVISDLYYADIYRYNETSEKNEFNDWNSNGDTYIGAWGMEDKGYDVENDTNLDLYPDVIVGRLACSNHKEVRDVVSKIINYERYTFGKKWFKKIVVVSGDGFMDQVDLDFQWNTTDEPDGKYTIYAQSRVGQGAYGVPEKVVITLDRSKETFISVHHNDQERINNFPNGYPTLPIAEIVNVEEGNILGFTNYVNDSVSEKDAYGNSYSGWANINFTDGILHIRGKTYDPEPYGNITNIRCWVENETGVIVFDDVRENIEMYYEGEWVCGNKTLLGGGGALYYMPEDFKQEVLFASNGKLTGPDDIIDALNEGYGFAFLSGHGSPSVWTDHFPGIPGNRNNGSIPAIANILWRPKILPIIPLFPLQKIRNNGKLPILLIGGCHNSQFNVSFIPTLLDKKNKEFMWAHGIPALEAFSWTFVRMPRNGAIATIGNTGLGYGVPGKECLVEGLDGGICIQFFHNYSIDYDSQGYAYLGDVYTDTLRAYHNQFDMEFLDHAKTLTQWVLLGDPSLRIGGYE